MLAAELVRLKVDLILVSGGSLPIRAAKNATKTIPIIMTGQGLDPVQAGLLRFANYSYIKTVQLVSRTQ